VISLGYLARKVAKTSSGPFADQLVMASFRPLVGTCRQENLESGRREDHRTHISPIGHQTGRLGEAPLPVYQGGPDRRPDGHPGRTLPGFLGSHLPRNVSTVEFDTLCAIGAAAESNIHARGKTDMRLDIIRIGAMQSTRQRNQAIQRAAVE
jgi:hypothetical protein